MFRQDFPLIAASENIFFDSASSAQKPAYVIQALRNFFEYSYANIHR